MRGCIRVSPLNGFIFWGVGSYTTSGLNTWSLCIEIPGHKIWGPFNVCCHKTSAHLICKSRVRFGTEVHAIHLILLPVSAHPSQSSQLMITGQLMLRESCSHQIKTMQWFSWNFPTQAAVPEELSSLSLKPLLKIFQFSLFLISRYWNLFTSFKKHSEVHFQYNIVMHSLHIHKIKAITCSLFDFQGRVPERCPHREGSNKYPREGTFSGNPCGKVKSPRMSPPNG